MAERSASDREGVGSSPTSGPQTANAGYATFQLAKALTTAQQHRDVRTRERAIVRAQKWTRVFTGMMDGTLQVGSRVPVKKTPAWVTLEVVTGGFATGAMLAGGELLDHETSLLATHALDTSCGERLALNRFYLTDAGMAELRDMLRTGCYEVTVPEEGALLVVAWLTDRGESDQARTLLDELAPFFDRLRFYPRPTERPHPGGALVFLQDVATTIESLRQIPLNSAIAQQKEVLSVWTPLYDELVSLLLETVKGSAPTLSMDESAGRRIQGGWPCQVYAEGWKARATDWLRRFRVAKRTHRLSSRPTHRKSSLAQLVPLMKKCTANPVTLRGHEVGRIRMILARYIAKRGLPGSPSCQAVRDRQAVQAETPVYRQVAAAITPRFRAFPGDRGVEDLTALTGPITDSESATCGVRSGGQLPLSIRRKVERCLCAPVEVLIERFLITSGDTLAEVLPQITSELRAAGIEDDELRGVYSAVYRAFRRRRSLLLLNLESQVRIEELPWVSAVERFRSDSLKATQLSRQALEEVTTLALTSFPEAIFPNKLLQELRALAKGSRTDVPLVDELAADIFMGCFTNKFVLAAERATAFMRGSLYQTYYGIDADTVANLAPTKRRKSARSWFTAPRVDEFAKLCCTRAGSRFGGWNVAVNGTIIEQQQILTTQNLATVFSELELHRKLKPQLLSMAIRCFEWVTRRLQANDPHWHARLIAIKNSAYAWRQMIFYLSFVDTAELHTFMQHAASQMAREPADFRDRFTPAVNGLTAASQGRTPSLTGDSPSGRQFLGWSKSRHWLMPD